jgi:phage nucleotide-binding protein
MSTVITAPPAQRRSLAGVTLVRANELGEWGVCAALYGRPGAGKTTLALSMADSPYASPTLMIDAEGGARSVSHRSDIDVATVERYEQIPQIIRALLGNPNPPYKGIVLDNMSEVQNKNIRSITGGTRTPEIQDWGRSTADILQLTRDCRELAQRRGIVVVLIAWEDYTTDESSGSNVKRTTVGFTPKLAQQFPGIVDIVGHLSTEASGTRTLSFESGPRTDGKFRRNGSEAAMGIPLRIRYNYPQQNPMADLLATLVGGSPWPKDKYERARPTTASTQQQAQQANTQEEKGDS